MLARLRLWVPVFGAALLGACSCSSSSNPGNSPHTASSAPVKPAVPEGKTASLLQDAWQKQSLTPTPPADDATFLRRATLDLWGTLPTPEDLVAFEADKAPDKRAKRIDQLLNDPRFSERFAAIWTDLLLGGGKLGQGVDQAAFRAWLKQKMEARAPWDSIVREILSGEGVNSPGGSIQERNVAAQAAVAEAPAEGVHGNVNYLLRYRDSAADLTGKTSRAFLGVQIQCAQCHDHKTEAWTTSQFKSLAAAFIKTRGAPVDRSKGEVPIIDVKDIPKARFGPKASDYNKALADIEPRALDGTALGDKDRRKALADWVVSAKSGTFAKAFVNRVWAQLLGRGFVDPVDDIRPKNPPVLPELFEALANGFVSSGHDVRSVYRSVCTSDAYQRSAGPPADLWASFALRPVPADVLFDAVVTASGLGPIVEEIAGERADQLRARTRQSFVLVMDVDEDAGNHSFEGSIAHALLLSNGAVSRFAARDVEGSALDQALKSPSDDARLDALYRRTLSRLPTTEERAKWKAFLDEAEKGPKKDPDHAVAGGGKKKDSPYARLDKKLKSQAKTPRERAYEDLFWALLNSTEMATQH
ncbi:MAG: DUF1549 domain-containing protein [Polyangiaceae bacterium]